MRRGWNVWLVAAAALAVGCTGGEKTAMSPGPETLSPAPHAFSALPAAGTGHYSRSITGTFSTGDAIPIPIEAGIWTNDDGTNLGFGFNYTQYLTPVDGSGWQVMDEFTKRPTGISGTVAYDTFDDPPDKEHFWNVGAGYMLGMERQYIKASANIGNAGDGSSDTGLFFTTLSYDYYVMKNFSVGAEWDYEHYSYDGGGSSAYSRYKANFGYLFDIANPVLVKLSYGRIHENGSADGAVQVGASLNWVISDNFLVGLSLDRMSDDDSWVNYLRTLGATLGYHITPASTVTVGYTDVDGHNLSQSWNGFNVGYSQRF